jgi:flagellin-like protein
MSDIKAFLFDDDRGVSPVIGVILMVAITVILAAVIAAFVLGLGDTSSTTPSVTFDFDYDQTEQNLTVTATGGDTVDAARLSIAGSSLGDAITDTDDNNATLGGDVQELQNLDENPGYTASETFSAGDSFVVNTTASDFELQVIFTSEDGGTSSEIGSTSGPEA